MTTVEKVIEARNPAFEIPSAPLTLPSPPEATTELSDRKIPDQELAPKPKPQKAVTSSQHSQSSTVSPEAKPLQIGETHATNQNTASDEQKNEELTRITQSPSEQDPYRIELSFHLSRELAKAPVPNNRQLPPKTIVKIELQLLVNGTLTSAKILNPTGIKEVDDAIYRASLAASPYPKPPENENQNRFEAELTFNPEATLNQR
ncbi:MAG TPA: TonB family protein [Marinobacter sp.]|nr:TonB family protein [Marinobacter sp.]